jgi:hypothetical protein
LQTVGKFTDAPTIPTTIETTTIETTTATTTMEGEFLESVGTAVPQTTTHPTAQIRMMGRTKTMKMMH